jgi:hypothetical protein
MEEKYTWKGWSEAFTIFAKYEPDEFANISVEHDIIYAGPVAGKVSDEDKARLEILGWHIDAEFDCFCRYT